MVAGQHAAAAEFNTAVEQRARRTQHIFKEELHYQLSVDATNYIHIPTKTTRMNPFTTFFQDNSAEPVPHTAEEIMKRARDIVVTI